MMAIITIETREAAAVGGGGPRRSSCAASAFVWLGRSHLCMGFCDLSGDNSAHSESRIQVNKTVIEDVEESTHLQASLLVARGLHLDQWSEWGQIGFCGEKVH